MKKLLLIIALLSFANPSFAEQQSAFIYTKTVLRIIPKSSSASPDTSGLSSSKGDKNNNSNNPVIDPQSMMPTLKRAPKEYTVEVRSPDFLEQTDFISHQPFADREGLLILIDPPAQTELKATRMISSADILFVDPDGSIIKIVPELKLSGLAEPIDSGRPIHAFVYLKSGTTSSDDIEIGDHIENGYFKTHPVVIQ